MACRGVGAAEMAGEAVVNETVVCDVLPTLSAAMMVSV